MSKAQAQSLPPAAPPSPFRGIRRAGVPIVAIETADPAATIIQCMKSLNGTADTVPIIKWDIIRGLAGLNTAGNNYVSEISPDIAIQLTNPAEMLRYVGDKVPAKDDKAGIVFMSNAHLCLMPEDKPNLSVIQAAWNIRDTFKSVGATLVMLAPMWKLPPEIQRDTVIISEELPKADDHARMVTSLCEDAGVKEPIGEERTRVIDTLLGLGTFEAEQALALSLTKTGVDIADLWQRKVKAIEQTDGLSVYRGKEKFADIGGLDNAKRIIGDTIKGKMKISCVVFLDEIDKSMAASNTDTSGTTQDQNKVLLSYMQDNDIAGILELGPPGTGKTVLAKAAANEYGIPLIMLDLGAMKGQFVGLSEQRMRQAIKIIHAVSDGRALFLGACNRTENLPPELRRRFNYASMFFDLPDEDERKSAWEMWKRKFELTPAQSDQVSDAGWTGAEIRNCCLKSWAMEIKLSEAANTIVPISRSAADIVEALRKSASGKYTSASKPGLYQFNATPSSAVTTTPSRKFQ